MRETGLVDELVEKDKPTPHFDLHCPFMSLPLAFNTQLGDIPSPGPYLYANPEKVSYWSNKLGSKTTTRVGIAWSGNPKHTNDHSRSMALELLLKNLPANFEYVSLQKDVSEADRQALSKRGVRHFEDLLTDFSETAALCENMDLVISVDTSVAHLSGALGKTTWVLLPFTPDWRWQLESAYSPWYPSVRLYRQGKDRQYAPVLEAIARDLKESQRR